MRFKSRLFPLIDVMILLLGLFLVILAKAQMTVEADQAPETVRRDEVRVDTPRGRSDEEPVKKGLVLRYHETTAKCFTIDTETAIETTAALLGELALRGVETGDECVITILHPTGSGWSTHDQKHFEKLFGDTADNRQVVFQALRTP